jgi:hypothetical protein
MVCPCPSGRSWTDCRARAKAIAPRSPVHVHKVQNLEKNKEKDIGKKQFLSLAELIKLHMVKSMNCVDWFLTTIPKCLLVFWRYLSMSRSDQIDQVSTREDIRGSAWNHPRILLSTFKWNVKAKHKIVKFNSGLKYKQKRSHIWWSKL